MYTLLVPCPLVSAGYANQRYGFQSGLWSSAPKLFLRVSTRPTRDLLEKSQLDADSRVVECGHGRYGYV